MSRPSENVFLMAYSTEGHEATVQKAPMYEPTSWTTPLASPWAKRQGELHFDILRKTILSAERVRKERGLASILLPGRDVWPLEVMAAKRGIPTIYIPELSRLVCYHTNALSGLLRHYGVNGSELIVDTGFVGSIVQAVGEVLGQPLQFYLMSQSPRPSLPSWTSLPSWMLETKKTKTTTVSTGQDFLPPLQTFPDPPPDAIGDEGSLIKRGRQTFNANRRPNQVFPNRRKARTEAIDTEYLPKLIPESNWPEALTARKSIDELAKGEAETAADDGG
jgi:hypothetical protein